MSNELMVFLTAMTPVAELRAAIPLGVAMGMPLFEVFLLSVIGNILPVPVLILFSRPVITWLKGFPLLEKILDRLEHNATRKAHKIKTYVVLGLFLFVAVPFPGTGAWTGSLIAALLDLRLKTAVPIIAAGVIMAGILIAGLVTGVSGIIHIFG